MHRAGILVPLGRLRPGLGPLNRAHWLRSALFAYGKRGALRHVLIYARRECIGYVRFHDAGMPFPADGVQANGQTVMHLPSAMFDGVLDVLRNEKPITFYFTAGHCFLGTGATEAVGEAE